MENDWSLNTKKYLLGLFLLEESYKNKKITKTQKNKIQKELDKSFKMNYWKLNPNLKHPLLKAIFNRILNTYDITDSLKA